LRNPPRQNRRYCPACRRRANPCRNPKEDQAARASGRQRPTGGDKAVATQKKQYFRRKKVCRFCVEKIDDINYKDVKMLHAFVAERGKIVPRRISGVCAPHQRRLTDAIKKARNIALLPFAAQF
jgi:small subunit ribosomal protein S18